jgi:Bacterial DNA-binding protein
VRKEAKLTGVRRLSFVVFFLQIPARDSFNTPLILPIDEIKERKGRNPATGDSMMLRPRRVVTFKVSGKLRRKVNGNSDEGNV